MNVLRELRKFKRKSVLVKLQVLFIFSIMLIASTYAWWRLPVLSMNTLQGKVESWDIEYLDINDNAILEEDITIAVDGFQPGMMDFEKSIGIRNLGSLNSKITYEITSVKLFGEEILSELQANNEIRLAGNTVNLFVNTTENKYPFDICYMYDKTEIKGHYVDDTTTPDAAAKVTFFATWQYEKNTDDLDTSYGQRAYEFYENPANQEEEALLITLRITSEVIGL